MLPSIIKFQDISYISEILSKIINYADTSEILETIDNLMMVNNILYLQVILCYPYIKHANLGCTNIGILCRLSSLEYIQISSCSLDMFRLYAGRSNMDEVRLSCDIHYHQNSWMRIINECHLDNIREMRLACKEFILFCDGNTSENNIMFSNLHTIFVYDVKIVEDEIEYDDHYNLRYDRYSLDTSIFPVLKNLTLTTMSIDNVDKIEYLSNLTYIGAYIGKSDIESINKSRIEYLCLDKCDTYNLDRLILNPSNLVCLDIRVNIFMFNILSNLETVYLTDIIDYEDDNSITMTKHLELIRCAGMCIRSDIYPSLEYLVRRDCQDCVLDDSDENWIRRIKSLVT